MIILTPGMLKGSDISIITKDCSFLNGGGGVHGNEMRKHQ